MTRKLQPARYTLLHEISASPTEPLPVAWRTTQLTSMYDGLAQLERGDNPDPDDWRCVSDAVNLLETLVEQGVVADEQNLLRDAVTAMAEAGKRHTSGGPLRLSGLGIQAVRAVLEDYATALEQLPARTMIRCHRLTEKRIREIYAGKGRKGDVQVVSV